MNGDKWKEKKKGGKIDENRKDEYERNKRKKNWGKKGDKYKVPMSDLAKNELLLNFCHIDSSAEKERK